MLRKSDLRIEYTRGKGAGGQHKNKTSSCVKITHIPSGITAMVDGRDQHKNKRAALRELERRLAEKKAEVKAVIKKERRDDAIHNTKIIRTYNYKTGTVTDHRTKKSAPLKKVMDKGQIELLR